MSDKTSYDRRATDDMPDDLGEESAKLMEMLKKKYRNVREKGGTVQAELGHITVTFNESTNENAVWASITVKDKIKGRAEDMMKLFDLINKAVTSTW